MDTFPTLLTAKMSQDSIQEKDQNVVITQLGDGRQQRIGIGVRPFFNTWTLVWKGMSHDDKTTLDTFYKQHGIIIPFLFTPPDSPEAKYVFIEPLQWSDNGVPAPHTRYSVTVKLKEVNWSFE